MDLITLSMNPRSHHHLMGSGVRTRRVHECSECLEVVRQVPRVGDRDGGTVVAHLGQTFECRRSNGSIARVVDRSTTTCPLCREFWSHRMGSIARDRVDGLVTTGNRQDTGTSWFRN